MTEAILCRRCGSTLYDFECRAARLCPRHLDEHRKTLPPVACTSADLAARDPDNDPACEACGHRWSAHEFGGCAVLTARLVTSFGVVVEDTPPRPCGCQAVDPMCVPLPPLASVTSIHDSEGETNGE